LRLRETELGFEVLTEQRILIEPGRYRVPDVCLMAVPYVASPVLERRVWSWKFYRPTIP
jgi:hypothetical protein